MARYDGDAESEGEPGNETGSKTGGKAGGQTGDADEHGVHGVHGVLAMAPDSVLTDLLRGDASAAQNALEELRARHRAAVLAYARLYTAGEPAARQLTDEAFVSAAHETVRGLDPKSPWRHHLLLLTGRVAASWARDGRAVHLAPGLLPHLSESEPATEPTTNPTTIEPQLLGAFQALPTRVQGLVWYGVVDEEPDERTATFLGCTRQDVTYGAESAFQTLRHCVLTALLARSADPDCQDFRRLIEEAAHPNNPRHSPDLQEHMAHCRHCAGAYRELAALRDTPRTALAEGLLAWGGTAYVLGSGSAGSRTAGAGTGAGAGAGAGGGAGAGAIAGATNGAAGTAASGRSRWLAWLPAWLPARGLALASAALGVAVAPLLVYQLSSTGSDQRQTAATQPPTRPPAATATPTPEPSPTTTPTTTKSPAPTTSSRPSKSPSSTPTPTTTKPRPKPTPTKNEPGPPNSTYAQVVNVSSGLCLDIRGGELEKGTDVVTAPCSSSRTQFWRVDSGRGVLQSSADQDYCLDSRGSTSRGVGIWECVSVDGPNGRNLRFTVDSDGTIVPAIAPDRAVAPRGSDTLFLLPDQGRADQRWEAGAKAD